MFSVEADSLFPWILIFGIMLAVQIVAALFVGWFSGILVGARRGFGRLFVIGIAAIWLGGVISRLVAYYSFKGLSYSIFSFFNPFMLISVFNPLDVVAAIVIGVALHVVVRAIERRRAINNMPPT